MSYVAPLKDLMFNIEHLANIDQISRLPGLPEIAPDVAQAVLDECARFAQDVLAPLNAAGDRNPSRFTDGRVSMTPGFGEAYAAFVAGGWQGLQHPVALGGQGLPKTIGAACGEIIQAANMSFALCPLLTDGAIEALLTAQSGDRVPDFLENLISGRWTGTMNLTEPQAGSDLSLIRTRAERHPDGTYRVFGTKIFITYGEHDQAENIIHLVLARVPDAPADVKGISLFAVPKFLVDGDGAIRERNDVRCVGIEHKLGTKASPTATLQYGDGGGAVGYLVGEENRGLEYMFVMMNSARFAVGVQGIAIAERSYQAAVDYARSRVQGRSVEGDSPSSVAIIEHPDVRRMLMRMRALIEGCRALACHAAAAHDAAHHGEDEQLRADSLALYEFLVPLVKGYSTEISIEVTSLGIQIHGGMGFIEETGVAQHLRDARILSIYEGTTAIQANDLLGRKTLRDKGRAAHAIAASIEETEARLRDSSTADAQAVASCLAKARRAFVDVVEFMVNEALQSPGKAFAGSVPYLMLAGNLVAGWQLARALLVAQEQGAVGNDRAFMAAKVMTARFYAEHVLDETHCLRDRIVHGADSVLAMPLSAW